MKCRQSVS